MPVEQIDRDAAETFIDNHGWLCARQWSELLSGDRAVIANAFAAHRAAERARILAAMREPDAAMVEAVKAAIMQAVRANLTCTATAALAAAADHMETRDAG